MRYFYFNPFNKQYYFPDGFQKYPLFTSFYKPYKKIAKFTWVLWRNSSLLRYLSTTIHPENYLPFEQIKQFVPSDSILAFNLGSIGIENKITILGVVPSTNETFFIKYAINEVSCLNVYNEGIVLKQLSHLNFVPQLKINEKVDHAFSLIKTDVLQGEKIKYLAINDQIMDLLFIMSAQKVKGIRNFNSGLLHCFAHGDFCPWNILNNNGSLKVFDWELAGDYPLGYDLFTYIFQYEFLVNEKMRFESILNDNSYFIKQYFNHFEIEDWIPYLKEFSSLKYKFESEKNDTELKEYFLRLKEFAV